MFWASEACDGHGLPTRVRPNTETVRLCPSKWFSLIFSSACCCPCILDVLPYTPTKVYSLVRPCASSTYPMSLHVRPAYFRQHYCRTMSAQVIVVSMSFSGCFKWMTNLSAHVHLDGRMDLCRIPLLSIDKHYQTSTSTYCYLWEFNFPGATKTHPE